MPGAWEHTVHTGGVLIATPNTGIVDFRWALSLLDMERHIPMSVRGWQGLPFDVARNQLVRDARAMGVSYVWFLDSDVLPPPTALRRLMSWKLPIVSGLVYSKRGYPAIWLYTADGQGYTPVKQIPESSLIEVAAIPMGCALIDVRVFDRISEPWFSWTIQHPAESRLLELSEDFEFCRRAQSFGFKICCDTGVRCHHLTVQALDPDGSVVA